MKTGTDLFNRDYLAWLAKNVKNRKLTEYSEFIGKFVEKLNPSRLETGYQPIIPIVVAISLSRAGIKPNQFYAFYRQCEQAKNFSKMFWWIVNTKRAEKRQLQLIK